jgi:hypothetical protein
MTDHKHRAIAAKSRIVSYTAPVVSDPTRQNPKAYGGVCHIDTCTCGAVRRTNSTGRHSERGPWQ